MKWLTHTLKLLMITIGLIIVFSCSSNEKIKVGVISPFSGDGAIYGQHLKNGFTIALEKLEKENQDFISKLELIYEDDELDSKKAVNAFNKLINVDKVNVVIGAFTSNTTLAIAPLAEKNKILLVTPTATNYKIKNAGDYIYRVCPSDAQQGSLLASYAIDSLSAKTVSILYMNTDYGAGLKETFENTFNALGGEVLSSDGFPQNATRFQSELTKIRKLSPDIIFMPSNWSEAANAVNQVKELNITTQILCTDGTFEEDFLNLTKGASEGILITSFEWGVGKSILPADEFKNAFKEKFNEEPGGYAALCYDALLVVSEALMKSDYENVKSIKESLDKVKLLGATGSNNFDEFGEVNKDFSIYRVVNNKFVKVN